MSNRKPYCRFCNHPLKHTFVDLGESPNANSYLSEDQLKQEEASYPLKVFVCERCFLVQLPEHQSPEKLFREYAYFSSYSQSWLKHAQNYVNKMIKKYKIGRQDQVIEIGSNDGYLLRYFAKLGIPVLGIDPAANVAKVAQKSGIPTLIKFFSTRTAQELCSSGMKADLAIGNNVLAQVPDLNDFVKGLAIILKSEGIITMEFPHLLQLVKDKQFDTVYHEHFSYFSFLFVQRLFKKHGLLIFDVEELPTHGGSLRIYAKHQANQKYPLANRVKKLAQRERLLGYKKIVFYGQFQKTIGIIKDQLLSFLKEAKMQNKIVVGYGAPAKGNTLLNFCGVKRDLLGYTVDKNPYKQGKYLPGSHIPIYSPIKIAKTKPDYVLILPWNIKKEIISDLSYIRNWGGKFLIAVPELKIIP